MKPEACAAAIGAAFDEFNRRFTEITRRACQRFVARDWRGWQQDASERLELYTQVVVGAEREVRKVLGEDCADHAVWAGIKLCFSSRLSERYDAEIAETFYNSVTRRFFGAEGVNASFQYVDSDFETLLKRAERPIYSTYLPVTTTAALVEEVLRDLPFAGEFWDLAEDAALVAARIDAHLRGRPLDAVEIVRPVFYRNKGAYVIGRIRSGEDYAPLVLPMLNPLTGVEVDAVLLDTDEASIVFSFTRSYFHVDAEKPRQIIDFLRSILPRKPMAELYISIGYNKHGKTELYRDLKRHLDSSSDRFQFAAGDKGLVMVVFTLPSFDVVFKIIRDSFPYPKTTTRREVKSKYHLVFTHDRVGRLVDAQEFEHLRVGKDRFEPDLLEELLRLCSYSVAVEGDEVHIKHVYVERRLVPLNVYLREASVAAARDAVIDYGNAIKELVSANIFPGDIMLKNFGVTRHGRVVFYDYDELCLARDCNFRDVPVAKDFNEELYAETYYQVGENDVFPEEFETFLGLQGDLRELYTAHHGDLFDPASWRLRQSQLDEIVVPDVFPYKQSRRLRGAAD